MLPQVPFSPKSLPSCLHVLGCGMQVARSQEDASAVLTEAKCRVRLATGLSCVAILPIMLYNVFNPAYCYVVQAGGVICHNTPEHALRQLHNHDKHRHLHMQLVSDAAHICCRVTSVQQCSMRRGGAMSHGMECHMQQSRSHHTCSLHSGCTDLKGRFPTVVRGARYSLPLKSILRFSPAFRGVSTCMSTASLAACLQHHESAA